MGSFCAFFDMSDLALSTPPPGALLPRIFFRHGVLSSGCSAASLVGPLFFPFFLFPFEVFSIVSAFVSFPVLAFVIPG